MLDEELPPGARVISTPSAPSASMMSDGLPPGAKVISTPTPADDGLPAGAKVISTPTPPPVHPGGGMGDVKVAERKMPTRPGESIALNLGPPTSSRGEFTETPPPPIPVQPPPRPLTPFDPNMATATPPSTRAMAGDVSHEQFIPMAPVQYDQDAIARTIAGADARTDTQIANTPGLTPQAQAALRSQNRHKDLTNLQNQAGVGAYNPPPAPSLQQTTMAAGLTGLGRVFGGTGTIRPESLPTPNVPQTVQNIDNAIVGGAAGAAAPLARVVTQDPGYTDAAAGYGSAYPHPGGVGYQALGALGSAGFMIPQLPLGAAGMAAGGALSGFGGGQMEVDRRLAAGETVSPLAQVGIPLTHAGIDAAAMYAGTKLATGPIANITKEIPGTLARGGAAVGLDTAMQGGIGGASQAAQNVAMQGIGAAGGYSGEAPRLTEGVPEAALGGAAQGLAMSPLTIHSANQHREQIVQHHQGEARQEIPRQEPKSFQHFSGFDRRKPDATSTLPPGFEVEPPPAPAAEQQAAQPGPESPTPPRPPEQSQQLQGSDTGPDQGNQLPVTASPESKAPPSNEARGDLPPGFEVEKPATLPPIAPDEGAGRTTPSENAPQRPGKQRKFYRGVSPESGGKTYRQGKGLYTTADKKYAAEYGDVVEVPADVAMPKNPLVLKDEQDWDGWLIEQFTSRGYKSVREFNKDFPDPGEYVKSLGYDGVVLGKPTDKDAVIVNYNSSFDSPAPPTGAEPDITKGNENATSTDVSPPPQPEQQTVEPVDRPTDQPQGGTDQGHAEDVGAGGTQNKSPLPSASTSAGSSGGLPSPGVSVARAGETVAPESVAVKKKSPAKTPFTKAMIERKLLAHHEEMGGGYTAADEHELHEIYQPFTFHGKLPGEVKNYIESNPAARRIFRVTDDPTASGGADAFGKLGDRYFDIVGKIAGSNLKAAKETAKRSQRPDMEFWNAVHDNLPPKNERPGQVAVDPAKLNVGQEFELNGSKFQVAEDADGYRVLKDGDDYPTTPIDAFPEGDKIPVDRGTLKQGAEPEVPEGDAFADVRGTDEEAAKPPEPFSLSSTDTALPPTGGYVPDAPPKHITNERIQALIQERRKLRNILADTPNPGGGGAAQRAYEARVQPLREQIAKLDKQIGERPEFWQPRPKTADDRKIEKQYGGDDSGDVLGYGGGKDASTVASAKPFAENTAEPKTATTATPQTTLQPMAVPELVSLARDILGGKVPHVRERMQALGYFKHVDSAKSSGNIEIRADLAEDTKSLAGTLAHEIGHAVDFLPEGTLKRGNILGRIATLHDYLKGKLANSVPPVERKAVHKELRDLSEWWRGPIVGDNAHAKYRNSSKELYADAISVLLNSPGHLQEKAPKFFDAFFKHIDAKPEVRDAYFGLMDLLNGTSDQLAETRRQDIREMFGKGEEIWKARKAEIEDGKQSTWSYIRQMLFDKSIPVLAKEKQQRGAGKVPWDQSLTAKHALEELNMSDNALHLWAKEAHEKVTKPLEDAGISTETAGEYLFLDRVGSGDRGGAAEEAQNTIKEMTGLPTWEQAKAEYASRFAQDDEIGGRVEDDELYQQALSGKINPRGHTPETARQTLANIEKELGPKKWATLQKHMQAFHDLQWNVVREAAKVGSYSREMVDSLEKNKNHYAPFAVLKYLDTKMKAGIFKQIGTFEDIANPFHSSLMKTLSLIRLNELTKAQTAVIDLLKSTGDITESYTIDKYTRMKPAGQGKDNLVHLENGKPVVYPIDAYIAKVFARHDIGALGRVAKWLGSSYRIFHPLWIGWNVGWQAMNVPRDLGRTYVNETVLHTDKGKSRQVLQALLSVPKIGSEYIRAIPPSIRRGFGWDDPLIDQMMKERAITTPFVRERPGDDSAQYDRILSETGLWEKPASRHAIIRGVDHLLDGLENVGTFLETLPKVAMFNMAKKEGMSQQERAYVVRNYAGTPNTKRRGLSVDLHNVIWTYSNVILQGYRADAEIGFHPKTATGRWVRAGLTNYMPKMAMAAAAAGAFGAYLKQFYDDVPEYDKAKYIVLPLGRESESGKPVYLRLPHNDTDRVVAAAAWKLAEEKGSEKFTGATDLVSGEFPGLNPYLQMAHKWGQYLSGQNPRDDFRNRDIIGRDEQKVGGWARLKPMLLWQTDQLGAPGGVIRAIAEWDKDTTTGQKKTTTEKIIGPIPGISRLLKVSDRGASEESWKQVDAEDKEKAELRLAMPENARRLNAERYRLNRLGDDKLSFEDKQRRAQINKWYSEIYNDHYKQIEAAVKSGNAKKADELRQRLENLTRQRVGLRERSLRPAGR